MFSLALHGKIAITEDVLTAAFFDALADEHDVALLKAMIQTAHPYGSPLIVPDRFAFAIDLWPRIPAGEPDVRIRLHDEGVPIATLLVEAKLWAPKSGSGELGEDGCSGDQLARYLLAESATSANVFLMYLTHHGARPDADLDESREHLRSAGRHDLADRFMWMSWRSIERHLSTSDLRAYRRVRELLRRVRMYWFEGIRRTNVPTLSLAPSFYRPEPITYAWPPVPDRERRAWRYRDTSYAWPPQLRRVSSTPHFYRGRNT